jgi:type III secretion protein Q
LLSDESAATAEIWITREDLVTLARGLRLRRISTANALALSELFHSRDVLVSGLPPLAWRFAPGRATVRSAVVLQGRLGKISMSLAEDSLRESVGAREWWDYSGESRLLAWMLTHATLLESLGGVLHDSFQPCGWSEVVSQTQPSATTMCLEFSARAADDRTTSGLLYLPSALVPLLSRHVGWQKPPLAVDSWGERLRARVRIVLRAMPFPQREVLAAEIGDVLILGRKGRCWRNLELICRSGAVNVTTWSACYDGDRIVVSAMSGLECVETAMSEQTGETARAATPASALENVPVTLEFEVGALSIPLGALAGIKPGYVFQLPGRLEEARVVIRANGVRIGSGELVAVDDVLGVQVLSIDPDGSF